MQDGFEQAGLDQEGPGKDKVEPNTIIRATVAEATDLPDSAFVRVDEADEPVHEPESSLGQYEEGIQPGSLDAHEPGVVSNATDLLDKVRSEERRVGKERRWRRSAQQRMRCRWRGWGC